MDYICKNKEQLLNDFKLSNEPKYLYKRHICKILKNNEVFENKQPTVVANTKQKISVKM